MDPYHRMDDLWSTSWNGRETSSIKFSHFVRQVTSHEMEEDGYLYTSTYTYTAYIHTRTYSYIYILCKTQSNNETQRRNVLLYWKKQTKTKYHSTKITISFYFRSLANPQKCLIPHIRVIHLRLTNNGLTKNSVLVYLTTRSAFISYMASSGRISVNNALEN
jgi:hypothetical protein